MKRNELLVSSLVFLLSFLTLTSCEENPLFNPSSFDDDVTVSLCIPKVDYTPFITYTRDGGNTFFKYPGKFKSSDNLYVYAKQDGKLVDYQIVSTSLSSDSTKRIVKYNEMKKINTKKQYDLYVSFSKLEKKNNKLYYSMELSRTNLYYGPVKIPNAKSGMTANCYDKGVLELTCIINKSNKPITFIHKGFKADELWYYDSALLSLDDNSVINGKDVTTDKQSASITIDPYHETGKYRYIYSCYPQNGNKIQNATLVAMIDGKEVRTSNTLSSDVIPVHGKAYCYTLEWDGKELRFVYDYQQLDTSVSNRDNVAVLESDNSFYTPLYDIVSYDLTSNIGHSIFNDDNNKRQVYAKQNGVWINCGRCTATRSIDKRYLSLKYNENGVINTTSPHEIAIPGGYNYMINGDLYYKCELKRGTKFYMSHRGTMMSSGDTLYADIQGTAERTFIINTSNAPIKFKLKGFDATNKWYYQSACVNIDNKKIISPVAVETDCESDTIITVPLLSSGSWKYLYSQYVPTGKKISNAKLVAEIDGKEVKTSNTMSSDLTLEIGAEYYYVIQWDGKELKFVSDEKGNTPSNVKLRAMPKNHEAKARFVPFSTEF